jgi:hypothetical protein
MMVDLRLPRNRKITTMTMIAASPKVFMTSQSEARMKLGRLGDGSPRLREAL